MSLSSSAKVEQQQTAVAAAPGDSGSSRRDCRHGSSRYPQFSMTLFFKAPAVGDGHASTGDDDMTMRDRLIIVVVLVAAALAGVWFVGLAPKRKEAADLRTQIDAASQQLAEAQQKAATRAAGQAPLRQGLRDDRHARQGRSEERRAALADLPARRPPPKLAHRLPLAEAVGRRRPGARRRSVDAGEHREGGELRQRDHHRRRVVVKRLVEPPRTPSPSSAPRHAGGGGDAAARRDRGSAGFPTMPFSFVFNGSFFDMESFIARRAAASCMSRATRVDVRGRLLSIDGFSLDAGPDGFPDVKASIWPLPTCRRPTTRVRRRHVPPRGDPRVAGDSAHPRAPRPPRRWPR